MLWSVSTWYSFSHPYISNLTGSLYFKCPSCKQYRSVFIFLSNLTVSTFFFFFCLSLNNFNYKWGVGGVREAGKKSTGWLLESGGWVQVTILKISVGEVQGPLPMAVSTFWLLFSLFTFNIINITAFVYHLFVYNLSQLFLFHSSSLSTYFKVEPIF